MSTVTLSTITQSLINNVDSLKYSNTVLNHAAERLYTFSTQTIKTIMEAVTPIKDESLKNGLKWVVEGYIDLKKSGITLDSLSKGVTEGVWELVIDLDTNTIVHYLFKGH